MPTGLHPWQPLLIYAAGGALLLMVLQRVPVIGRFVRFAFSAALLALMIFLLLQVAPYQPELSRLTGRTVRHLAITEEAARAGLLAAGRPAWEVDGVVANFRMTRGNAYGFDAVTTTVRDVTGRPPRSVEDFLRENLKQFIAKP